MPVMPPGSGQVPQVPLAQFGSPSSLGMFGNFTNVSHQMGSQMGYPNESNAPQSQTMSGNQHFCGSRELWRVLSAELMSWTMQCTHNSDFSFGFLDQTAGPSASPQVSSAFEMLGKSPATATQVNGVSNEETMMESIDCCVEWRSQTYPKLEWQCGNFACLVAAFLVGAGQQLAEKPMGSEAYAVLRRRISSEEDS